jgi:hypothetical protein
MPLARVKETEGRNVYRVLEENITQSKHLQDLVVDGRTFKWALK